MPKQLLRIFVTLSLACTTLPASADNVDTLRQFYDRTTTLQSAFSQKVFDEKGQVTDSMRGQLWLARPDTFRWEYREPYQQIIVNDGQRLWLYDVDLDQVTVRPAGEALAGAPVWLLNGGPALDEQFRLENEGQQDELDWVRMVPKSTEGDFRLARMGMRQGLPHILELTDALGQRTVITFEDMSRNLVISPERFRFTPPEGVEVVEG